MSPRRLALALCCSLVASPLAATELLLPGDYHGDEVTARDREIWLTLVLDAEGRTHLEPRPVAIDAIHDAVLDELDAATGKRVGAGSDDALFHVRDIAGATAGNIVSAYIAGGEPLIIDAQFDRSFQLDGRDAGNLRLECGAPDRDALTTCALRLRLGQRSQTLATWQAEARVPGPWMLGNDAYPHLRWAGDLDRDGRLDLLIDVSDHYNVSQPTLFLSSQASDGELVHAAAALRSLGC